MYTCPYFGNMPIRNAESMYNNCRIYPCPYCVNTAMYNQQFSNQYANENYPLPPKKANEAQLKIRDFGPEPFVVNIEEATKQNNNFRAALWTGKHLQLTLMSINVGEDIGLEVHPHLDQFLRVEEGQGIAMMGDRKDKLNFREKIHDDFAVFIPAGKWHNVVNTGNIPLKLYSIYAPPQHPKGTIHETKAIAEAAEHDH